MTSPDPGYCGDELHGADGGRCPGCGWVSHPIPTTPITGPLTPPWEDPDQPTPCYLPTLGESAMTQPLPPTDGAPYDAGDAPPATTYRPVPTHAELADRARADGHAPALTDIADLLAGITRQRDQLADATRKAAAAGEALSVAIAERASLQPLIAAAQAWRVTLYGLGDDTSPEEDALAEAVDALAAAGRIGDDPAEQLAAVAGELRNLADDPCLLDDWLAEHGIGIDPGDVLRAVADQLDPAGGQA